MTLKYIAIQYVVIYIITLLLYFWTVILAVTTSLLNELCQEMGTLVCYVTRAIIGSHCSVAIDIVSQGRIMIFE
jgi:hypothetical protein